MMFNKKVQKSGGIPFSKPKQKILSFQSKASMKKHEAQKRKHKDFLMRLQRVSKSDIQQTIARHITSDTGLPFTWLKMCLPPSFQSPTSGQDSELLVESRKGPETKQSSGACSATAQTWRELAFPIVARPS